MDTKLNTDPFAVLSNLSNIGKKKKEVDVDGTKITLETLTAEDEAEVFSTSKELQNMEFFARTRIETIIRAICEVNGAKVRTYENIVDRNERTKAKTELMHKMRDVIGSFSDDLVVYMYTEYGKLVNEADEEFKKLGIVRAVE